MGKTRTEIVTAALGIETARRRGGRAWSMCPYERDANELTAFFVRYAGEYASTFHCFSCHKSGSLTDLVMMIRKIDRKAAKAFIAKAGTGYEPPKARVRVIEQPAILSRLRFQLPREVIIGKPLDDWSTLPHDYTIGRGITGEEVERFGLGYAVGGRLEGRIVFPVRVNPGARVESYSARSFVGAERKYLTPHETEGADLDAMFGEHLWSSSRLDATIAITEGAIDALAVKRACPEIDVASISGSDVRPGHVIKLATFARVILLTDNDGAGHKAARGFASSLGRRALVHRLLLPEGLDAASMAQGDLRETLNTTLRRWRTAS